MSNLAGTTYGFGAPTGYPGSALPWGFSPQVGQAFGGQGIGGYGAGQPLQQIQQLLQILPVQIQQLQALQLQQLQQLIQIIPQQIHQQAQPFGQAAQNPFGLGFLPQSVGSQVTGHVM
jgi:hypothetical protein